MTEKKQQPGANGGEQDQEAFTSVGACTVDGKPFVMIEWGDKKGQLDPAAAISEGLQLITAAIESQRDAAVVRWGLDDDIPLDHMGVILQKTREYRDQIDLQPVDTADQARREELRQHDPRSGGDGETEGHDHA